MSVNKTTSGYDNYMEYKNYRNIYPLVSFFIVTNNSSNSTFSDKPTFEFISKQKNKTNFVFKNSFKTKHIIMKKNKRENYKMSR